MGRIALQVALARATEAHVLATVAAQTFPLACPPQATRQNIDAFISTHLTADNFSAYLADTDRAVLAAYDDGRIVGYCILIRGVPDDPDVQLAVRVRPSVELSKMYVLAECHGSGASAALMQGALDHASQLAARSVWLGVNRENHRAQRFYTKHGFTINGAKTFQLGDTVEHDYVMIRPI